MRSRLATDDAAGGFADPPAAGRVALAGPPSSGTRRDPVVEGERVPSTVVAWVVLAWGAYGGSILLEVAGSPGRSLEVLRLACVAAGVAGIVSGIRRNRPRSALPWALLAALVASWAAGPLEALWRDDGEGPSLGGRYLLGRVFVSGVVAVAALAIFVRRRGALVAGRAALDVVIVVATYGGLLLHVAVLPRFRFPPTPVELADAVVGPVTLLAVLVLMACLGFVDEVRGRSFGLLAGAVLGAVLPSLVVLVVPPRTAVGQVAAETMPLTIFLLCAAAADPSMRELTERSVALRPRWGFARSLILGTSFALPVVGILAADRPTGAAVLVAPVLLLVAGVALTQRARLAVGAVVAAERSSRRAAATDALTGLLNRRGFIDHLGTLADEAQGVGVAFIDLDRFKSFNDVHGHSAGDDLLRAVADRIREVSGLRAAARIGGDEFAIAYQAPRARLVDEGDGLGTRVLAALSQPYELHGHDVTIGASIGLADLADLSDLTDRAAADELGRAGAGAEPGGGLDPAPAAAAQRHPAALDLLRRADLAQYEAKSRGGSRVVRFAADLDRVVQRRARVIEALRPGRGDLRVVFQAIVRITDGAVVGAEALARLRSPGLGDIPPSEFVEAAERNGQIIPVGRQVFAQVVDQVRANRSTLPADFRVSVNVSPLQLDDRVGLADLEALAVVEPEVVAHLRIEVTESALATETTRRSVGRLSAAGYQIAIDDFGSDYASLQYLATMHVDVLKLDRSFVARALTSQSIDAAIIRHVVELAGELGVEVVAEGVETERQARLLASIGCCFGQGFRWDRPAPGLGRLAGRPGGRVSTASTAERAW